MIKKKEKKKVMFVRADMPETMRVKYPLVPPGLAKFSAKRPGGNNRAMFKVRPPSQVNQVILSAKKPVRVLND